MSRERRRSSPTSVAPDVLAELYSGQSVALLQELHILTRDARLHQDSRRKLKQVTHLLQFIVPLLQQALQARGDVVTALHACDTATDDAIDFALQRQAQAIVVVPCWQAEVAAVLRRHKALQLARTPLAELWRHPLHTREFGSQVTNVMRCLRLEAMGYDVTVTELVGWEHSLKNELILAQRTGRRKRSAAERLARMLDELGLAELRARFAVA